MAHKVSLFERRGWKLFMGKLYGLGAAVVIAGALFKLMHWPGAGIMLTIGMSVEGVIFVFSAFEPLPHPEPHWEIVYPELMDGFAWEVELPERTHGSSVAATEAGAAPPQIVQPNAPPQQIMSPQVVQQAAIPAFTGSLDLSGVDTSLISSGLNKLGKSVEKLNVLSETAVAAGTFTEKIQQASQTISNISQSYENSSQVVSESMLMLSDTYQGASKTVSSSGKSMSEEVTKTSKKMSEIMTSAADGFSKIVADSGKQVGDEVTKMGRQVGDEVTKMGKQVGDEVTKMGKQMANVVGGAADEAAKVVADSGKLVGEEITKTGKQMAGVVGNATEIFATTFTVIDQHIKTSMEGLKHGNSSYNKQIESLNKNMTALNTIYELQSQEVSKYHKNSTVMGQQLEKYVGELKQAAEANHALHKGVAQLNQSIGELNNIYGSMLSAVQMATKKR
jgi:gliding motility-associated protein GldL